MVVAGYLNASFGLDYPFTTQQIKDMWDAAVAADTRDAFLTLASELKVANELGCPIR